MSVAAPGLRVLGLRLLLQLGAALAVYALIVLLHEHLRLRDPDPLQRAWRFEPAADNGAPTRDAALPDRWQSQEATVEQGLYRGRFALPAVPVEPWAVYLESAGTVARVRVNGALLGEGGRMQAPLERMRWRPLLLQLPTALLRPGANELTVELAAFPPGAGFLGPVRIDALAVLEPQFRQRELLKVGLPRLIAMVAVILGSLSFLMWLTRRSSGLYLWHALACWFCGLGCAWFVLPLPALPGSMLDVLLYALLCWIGIAGGMTGMHFAQALPPKLVRAHLGLGFALLLVLLTVGLLVPAAPLHRWVLPLCLASTFLLSYYTIPVIWFGHLLPRGDLPSFAVLQAAVVLVPVSFHDLGVISGGYFGWPGPWDGVYFSYALPVTLLGLTAVVLRDFLAALREAEQLNRELADRVAAREREIERQYQALRRVEQDRAVAEERERLFADMHDGLGGALVAALARLDNQGAGATPVAHAVQDALTDLRLILSSADPDEGTLRAALAQLRQRLEPACIDAGVELCFELAALPDPLTLAPRRLLHLLRVVQEACNNVLRHAGARQLRVVARVDGNGTLQLLVEDDGRGFDFSADSVPGHRGLANMRRRAQRLGGHIEWSRLQPGTCVSLQVPLQPPDAAAA